MADVLPVNRQASRLPAGAAGSARRLKIALGADHRGFELKEQLKRYLTAQGHTVIDVGTSGSLRCDYPDFAFPAARAVAERRADRGILICFTGIGMSIAANRLPAVRAALCSDVRQAKMSREHNDANVLCLGAGSVTPARAKRIVGVWLATPFAGGRHRRRLAKIRRYVRDRCGASSRGD